MLNSPAASCNSGHKFPTHHQWGLLLLFSLSNKGHVWHNIKELSLKFLFYLVFFYLFWNILPQTDSFLKTHAPITYVFHHQVCTSFDGFCPLPDTHKKLIGKHNHSFHVTIIPCRMVCRIQFLIFSDNDFRKRFEFASLVFFSDNQNKLLRR